MLTSFDNYLEVVKNKTVTVCPKCGSYNTTNYNFVNCAECYKCGHHDWNKKFEYKTIGMLSK